MAVRWLLAFVVSFALIPTSALSQGCLIDAMPITEDKLLDPSDEFDLEEVSEIVRDSLLTLFGFDEMDSFDPSSITVYTMSTCQLFEDDPNGVTITLYDVKHVINKEGENRDESFFMTSSKQGKYIDHLCIGQLITTCASTFLRGSFIGDDDVIELQSLEHYFDCETAEFVETQRYPTLRFELLDDGRLRELKAKESDE